MKKSQVVARSKTTVEKRLRTSARKKRGIESVKVGSGNVFADLGFENAHEKLTKARLTAEIGKAIERRSFKNQSEVAVALGIDQPKVSKLLRGHFAEYSIERLLGFLTLLGCDVRIEVTDDHARKHKAGRVDVIASPS